ncbi:MAG: hypothetical protein KatS3mg085_399 [Candidatus Dojkabacteria bacterium]|nr:MAG: hypothetical protein KatS3mg085_399 [Candidatus Dojkabacteria bacterium]
MSNKGKQLFKFNLIPPKSKQEQEVLAERDNSLLYSVFLIFFVSFVYFLMTVVDTFVIIPRIQNLDKSIAQQTSQIKTYDFVRELKGELFVKAQVLEPLLELDIEAIELLRNSDLILTEVSNAQIVAYEREPDGTFVITVIVDSYEDSKKILDNALNNSNLDEVFLRQARYQDNNATVRVTLAFVIKSDLK